MLPLSDDISARRFPAVNVSLIVADFAVWIFYELPEPGELCPGPDKEIRDGEGQGYP